MRSEATIKVTNAFVIGISHCEAGAPAYGASQRRPEAHLIGPGKNILVVLYEAIHVVTNGIWRIDEDEIAFRRLIDCMLEIPTQ